MADSALTPLTPTPAIPQPTARATALPPSLARIGDQLPPGLRSRIVPVAILASAALAALLIWSIVAADPQRQLFPSMAEEDKALVAAALDGGGVAYTLDQATGAIEVAEGDYHRARMLLAAEGLPKAPPAASGMLDTIPLGSSRAVEGERLRLARESDLARTIEAIEAVEQARVHLAVEQRSAFVRDRAAPAASVMLRLAGGRTLTEAQTDAIVHLVASSVPGLDPGAVSVIDQGGRLLSGAGRSGNSPADQQLRIQAETEERLRQALNALLTPIVGADNFSAQVNAQLSFDERQATRETFPEAEQRLTREEGSRETGETGAGVAQGIPGALANRIPAVPTVAETPPPPAGAAGTAGAGTPPSSETFSRQFQWGREVSVTRAASGTVRRLTVAVALANPPGGRPRSQAEINAIQELVRAAVGYDAARGDVVTVSARRFAPTASPDAAASVLDSPWIDTAIRAGAALLVILALFFFIVRPMLRAAAARRQAEAEAAAQIAALPPPVPDGGRASEPPASPAELDRIMAAQNWTERAALVRDFAANHPDSSAQVIHDLLRQKETQDRG